MKTFILLLAVLSAEFASAQVVINEVYGAGGNAGALFTHDFIELYNNGAAPVDLSGWSVQYASATSTGTWQVTLLSGVIEPGRTFLIQGAGGVNGSPLPLTDVTGTLSMAATAGKVALVQSVTPLSGACPVSALVIDRVGYGGSANCFEGAGPAPAPSATLSVQRQTPGVDTNSNTADFRSLAPTPANSLPRTQVVSFSTIPTHVYGDSPFSVIVSASSGLPVTVSSADPSKASVSGTTVTILGAGDLVLTASQPGNGTYAPASMDQALHIDKAILTVSVESTSRLVGNPNPSFTILYSGFVGSDNSSVLDSPPLPSCVAIASSVPGEYPIVISGGIDNNYEFNYEPGILSVLPPISGLSFLKTPEPNSAGVGLSTYLVFAEMPGASTYTFEVSQSPVFANIIAGQSGGRTQRISGLDPGTTYFVRVKTDLSPLWGPVRSFHTASSVDLCFVLYPLDRYAPISWMPEFQLNPAGASGYILELSESADFAQVQEFGPLGLRFTLPNPLKYRTRYFTRVRPENEPGQWGQVVSFISADPADFSRIQVPAEGAVNVNLQQRIVAFPVPGASTYELSLSENEAFTNEVRSDLPNRSGVLTLKPSTVYYARVRTNLSGAWGRTTRFTTGSLEQFTVLSSPVPNSQGVGLSTNLVFADMPGALTYIFEVSDSPGFLNIIAAQTGGRTQRVTGLEPGTTYFVRVKTNLSPLWGPVRLFHTAPMAELCYVQYPADRYAPISWLPEFQLNPAGATGYVIELSESVDFAQGQEFGPFGLKFTLPGSLKFRTRYYARVRPADALGNWGPVRAFTTADPTDFALVKLPADGAMNVDTVTRVVVFPVPGAMSYEISLSKQSDFTSIEKIQDAPGRSAVVSLQPATTYYIRMRTNLSQEWGRAIGFTTKEGKKTTPGSRRVPEVAAENEMITSLEPKKTLQFYPNPFSATVSVCPGEPAFVTIMDVHGQQMFSGRVSENECCELGSEWSPGIYVATLVTGSGRRTMRLIKSR